MPPPPSKLRRALAAVIFSALAALSFGCSDSPSSVSVASAATPAPTSTATPSPAPTSTATPAATPTATPTAAPTSTATPSPAPVVPSVISHSAAISEDNPLIAFVRVELSAPARVAVEYENEYAGKFRTALSETASEHVIPVARLRADTVYEYAVGVENPDGALAYGARGEFVTGELSSFATMRSEASGRSSQSLILSDYLTAFHSGVVYRYLVMLDEFGEIVWRYVDAEGETLAVRPAEGVRFLPNGNIMYALRHPDLRGIYEITPLGEFVNRIEVRPHHDFIILDDGRIVYISRYRLTFDDSHNGGDAEMTARVDTLEIYDPTTGESERVWDAAKFWDISDRNQRVEWEVGGNPVINWTHMNSVSQSPDGGWIVSVRNRDQVVSLSPDFKTIHWQLGGPESDFDFPDPTDRFDMQHTATQLPNGNVLVFDNRADLPDGDGQYSRALELRLDFDTMTAVKAWEFSPDPPIYAAVVSSAYPLDSGGALINFGITEDLETMPIAIIEADAEGREIFRLETIDPPMAAEARFGPMRYRAYPGPKSIIGETMLRAPKPKR